MKSSDLFNQSLYRAIDVKEAFVFLYSNGAVLPASETPPVTTFLQTHPGAYTTTRTHNNASFILFWDRHVRRLAQSLHTLLHSDPSLLYGPESRMSGSLASPTLISLQQMVQTRVTESVFEVLPVALRERDENAGEELAITALVGGNCGDVGRSWRQENEEMIDRLLDVYVHIGMYVPPVFGVKGSAAHLAVVGSKRYMAQAKYSDWARQRTTLEPLRPPTATELLLSDDGDHLLEGSITNLFVVCLKDGGRSEETLSSYEVQTAPVHEGVLPGVVRQLVIEVCLRQGIAVREVAPSWSRRETWQEAFITNSLRLMQHVETIKAPSSWDSLQLKSWKEISWVEKQFKEGPGLVTTAVQSAMIEKAALEESSLSLVSTG